MSTESRDNNEQRVGELPVPAQPQEGADASHAAPPSPITSDSPESGEQPHAAPVSGEERQEKEQPAVRDSSFAAAQRAETSDAHADTAGSGAADDSADEENHDEENHDEEIHDEEIHDEENDDEELDDEIEEDSGPVEPIEEAEAEPPPEEMEFRWYILKVQVNREDSIREALQRRISRAGLDAYFGEIVVPTEDVVEFNKSGKKRTVKRKLYPGYIIVNMALTEETWFLVRETPGIGDFTGSAGKPTPMDANEVRRIIKPKGEVTEGTEEVRIAIPFNVGDRVRVKEGYFQNFEGDVESIDQANGRVTVMINIFGRSTPVELQHWQMERV